MNILAPAVRRLARLRVALSSWALQSHNAALYNLQAQHDDSDEVIGDGPYGLIGQMELELLVHEGLRAGQTLLDFGCGTGRLAIHAIRALDQGRYIGIDLSPVFLRKAERILARFVSSTTCRVHWQRQAGDHIALPDCCVDMACAFSVFTHMEHEDSFRLLRELRRVVRPGGKLVFSCLPMNLAVAQELFRHEADRDFARRWKQVRNVTTSVEMMNALAVMAGWRVERWYPGDEPLLPGRGQFGQSCCVLI